MMIVFGLIMAWISGFLAGIVATHFAETRPSGGDRHGE
ncbi:hypothetical protein OHAE_314 [Ochrobactrum soli]|uniref:Uncharacterized protein n=1 Tax=Ochrobactrum soli TaxID=2448455 RepID=A0A2P9HK19_9HYPH|nr:hypothetical protein OHAE_314 [[Ochrobactrum] soli]